MVGMLARAYKPTTESSLDDIRPIVILLLILDRKLRAIKLNPFS